MQARNVLESYKEEPKILWKNIYLMEKHPDMFKRRFRRRRRTIKNLITSVKLEKQHSNIDQANVEVLKQQCRKWANIHSSPRY